MSTDVPFIHGRAVTSTEMCGRRRELRKLVSRIRTSQSTAIIGMPRVGKTSVLAALYNSDLTARLTKESGTTYTFSYLDAQRLRGCKAQADFWAQALAPIAEELRRQTSDLASAGSLEIATENGFGSAVLQQFFVALDRDGRRFVMVLDEFDDFLAHPVLNSAEFYGGLRSLASLNPGFTVVIGARKTLDELNLLTQLINPHGSPYFNIFTEINLGILSETEFRELVSRGESRFSVRDYAFLSAISGRHPYLAQLGAALLWESYEDAVSDVVRFRQVARGVYREASKHFSDCWRLWSNETKKALTAIALEQIPNLISPHEILVEKLSKDLLDYAPELEALETNGLIQQQTSGEWKIQQAAFIWFLASEILRSVRVESDFREWLRAQEIDGILTTEERKKLASAAQKVSSILKNGVNTLIEAFSKGFGEAMGKGVTGKT